jgi:hypothetical protein
LAFALLDIGISAPQIAITGNVFQGILPKLDSKLSSASLPILPLRPTNSQDFSNPVMWWEFLNTVTT